MGSRGNRMTLVRKCVIGAVLVALSGCVEKQLPDAGDPSTTPPAVTAAVPPPHQVVLASGEQSYRETGIASWYGKEFHGRKTASGETFNMYALSAAHRTLPLGTTIRVTNLDNFKTVRLEVNDRGPFTGNTVLEVSYAAARELSFVSQGTARVRIECTDRESADASYSVQAAVFSEEENAQFLKDRLSKKYELIIISPFESNLGKFFRVMVGSYSKEEKAEHIAGKLKLEGLEPFVVRKD